MQIKSSAVVFAAFAVGPLLLIAGCGGSTGDGSSSLLSPIQPSSYVTIEPATTTTTTTIALDPSQPTQGQISPVEQSYTIAAGDSLSKIASLYEITVEVLVNYNGWTDGTDHLLLAGDVILIPPNTVIPGTGSAGDELATEPSDENSDAPACTHTIAAGENPSKVAEKYGVTFDELQSANPFIDFTTTFVVGDVIKIPVNGTC
jgi:LysM repeat protein